MRYRLRTLMIFTGVGPPVMAFVWHAWGFILLLLLVAGVLGLWYFLAWVMARLCGDFVASLMG